jgi:hypothetical protein
VAACGAACLAPVQCLPAMLLLPASRGPARGVDGIEGLRVALATYLVCGACLLTASPCLQGTSTMRVGEFGRGCMWCCLASSREMFFLRCCYPLPAGDKHEGLKTKGRGGQEDAPDSSLGEEISKRTGEWVHWQGSMPMLWREEGGAVDLGF